MDLNRVAELAASTLVYSEDLHNQLVEFVGYNSLGMRVTVTDTLKTIKQRIEAGEVIKYYKDGSVFTTDSFKNMIWNIFGEEICEDVFNIELD